MPITYSDTKIIAPAQLERLFLSIGWESGKYPERLSRAMANSSLVLTAWDGDRLVGLVRALDDGEVFACIHYFLVDAAYQGHGIAGQLMERLLERYKDMLYVKVMVSGHDAVPFYKHYGFTQFEKYTPLQIQRL